MRFLNGRSPFSLSAKTFGKDDRSTSQSSGRRSVTQQPLQTTMGKLAKILAILLLSLVTGLHLRLQAAGITKLIFGLSSLSSCMPPTENQVIFSSTASGDDKTTPRKNDCGAGVAAATASNSSLYWREIATGLAQLPVKQLLKRLEDDDPFGVRTFERKLIDLELRLSRTLTLKEIQQLFPCPRSCLLTSRLDTASLPAPTAFREGNDDAWILFQHLRKAGGTHFCSLAKVNLPETAIPPRLCQADLKWGKTRSSAQLKLYSNAELLEYMKRDGFKIAENEWNPMASRFLEMTSVVTATSFRKPMDRALSQFRFDCLELHGCKFNNITEWWNKWKGGLSNVYTRTFADQSLTLQTYLEDNTTPDHAQKRAELLGKALDIVQRLHLVLIMEWLSYAGPQIKSVLGFSNNTSAVLTQRVRPFIEKRPRNDSQATNKLGAASITQASWDPKTHLTVDQYERMSELLALDMILNDAARRIFLERLVCNTGGASMQQ